MKMEESIESGSTSYVQQNVLRPYLRYGWNGREGEAQCTILRSFGVHMWNRTISREVLEIQPSLFTAVTDEMQKRWNKQEGREMDERAILLKIA
ncbi:Thiol peroxidase [Dirofilaria immitis]